MKPTRRLASGALALAAVAAVTAGPPATAGAVKGEKVTASVTADGLYDCELKWTATGLAPNTIYGVGVMKGVFETETWAQMVAANAYIASDNVMSDSRGVIRNTVSSFSNTLPGTATQFTVALTAYQATTVLARDVTVPNRCT